MDFVLRAHPVRGEPQIQRNVNREVAAAAQCECTDYDILEHLKNEHPFCVILPMWP